MTISKKLASASSATDFKIRDVFSVYGYQGEQANPNSPLIHPDIDIAGTPTSIWTKRTDPDYTSWAITSPNIMGYSQYLQFDDNPSINDSTHIDSIPSTGGLIYKGGQLSQGYWTNQNATDCTYRSYAFREHERFFKEKVYFGTSANNKISHGLKEDLGMALFKNRAQNSPWFVWHKNGGTFSSSGNNYYKNGKLNNNDPFDTSTIRFAGNATSGQYGTVDNTAGTFWLGAGANNTLNRINQSGNSHIAYFFANHTDSDDSKNFIKCDGFTVNHASGGQQIDIGFEPQFLLIKGTNYTHNPITNGDWMIWDSHSTFCNTSGQDNPLKTNDTYGFNSTLYYQLMFNANGFYIKPSYDFFVNSQSYLYMAIRKDDDLPKTDIHKKVFAYSHEGQVDSAHSPSFRSSYVTDFRPDSAMEFFANSGTIKGLRARKLGNGRIHLNAATSGSDWGQSSGAIKDWNYTRGWKHQGGSNFTDTTSFSYMWRSWPGVTDHQIYRNNISGSNASTFTVKHNLGVVPEMMIIKRLVDSASYKTMVYHKDISLDGTYLDVLDYVGSSSTGISNYLGGQALNNTNPTSTHFVVKGGDTGAIGNLGSNENYSVHLFASMAGVCAVGSVSVPSNSTVSVTNSFPSSPKLFILYRRIKDNSGNFATGEWRIHSTDRGIDYAAGLDKVVTPQDAGQETQGQFITTSTLGGSRAISFQAGLHPDGYGTYAYLIFAYTD